MAGGHSARTWDIIVVSVILPYYLAVDRQAKREASILLL
jgi:hypothetical protein